MKTTSTLFLSSLLALAVGAADFSITDFGAKSDGSKCTAAFAAAMTAAAREGGRVVVPAGTWTTGAIHLKSNVTLQLDEGAVVDFTDEPADYLPAVFTSWEGMECWNYSPLVYAYECENIAITGKGTLRPRLERWMPWSDPKGPVQKTRRQLYMWGQQDTPVAERDVFKALGEGYLRPQLLQLNRCRNVRLEDFRIQGSPFWTVHLYICENCTVRGLDVCAHGRNNDGIDIEMSQNVLVENCRFDQGDDGIVIKAGRNRDGWRLNHPTENVTVRNCEIVDSHTVFTVGSEISSGVRNVLVENITAHKTFNVFYLKTNHRRGGFIENVTCRNVTCDSASESVFGLETDVLYEWKQMPEFETRLTRIEGIVGENLHCGTARDRILIFGDERLPPKGIRLKNVTADRVTSKDLNLRNIGDLVIER